MRSKLLVLCLLYLFFRGLFQLWVQFAQTENYNRYHKIEEIKNYNVSIRQKNLLFPNTTQTAANISDSVMLSTERFIIIPPDMLHMMGTDCGYEICGIITHGYNNNNTPEVLRNDLLALGQRVEMLERRTHWVHTDILDLNDAVIGGEGDVTGPCNQSPTNSAEVIGSFGCKKNVVSEVCATDTLKNYDRVIVISQFWGYGYFHGIVEGLPRLMAAFHALENTTDSSIDEWVVHSMLGEPLASQIAQFMGVRAFISGTVSARRVLVPMPTPCGGNLGGINTVRLQSFVRSKLFSVISQSQAKEIKPLFVLIKRTGPRSLANHEDILEACKRLWKEKGEVVEHANTLSFQHQMETLYSAAVIMGPHGAGLSNAIAMKKGSAMLEVLPERNHNRFNPCYISLAFTLDLKYYALRAPGFDAEGIGILPIARLEETVMLLIH